MKTAILLVGILALALFVTACSSSDIEDRLDATDLETSDDSTTLEDTIVANTEEGFLQEADFVEIGEMV